MAIHKIDMKSEAMREICKEWRDQKRELETLRTYIKDFPRKTPQSPKTLKPSECYRGLKFSGSADQQLACRKCNLKYPQQYRECQELKGEKD